MSDLAICRESRIAGGGKPVSRDRHAASGLGLSAQREAIARYIGTGKLAS
jgi:hypothetical protein